MNLRNIATVSVCSLAFVLQAVASPMEYKGYQNPHKWHDQDWCRLSIQRVYQPNENQPLHVVMSNEGRTRIGFDMRVVLRSGTSTETGMIHVDNFNPTDDHQDRPTDKQFRGNANGRVSFEITNCVRKG